MTDDEARAFENHWAFDRGKYSGKLVGQVPCEYCAFWVDGDDFARRMRRYVASDRFKARINEEDDDE